MQDYFNRDISINEIIQGKGFPAGLYFMKKKIAKLIYPLDSSIIYEDWYIFMMLRLNNITIKYVDKSLGMYRQVPNSDYRGVNNFKKRVFKYRTERDIKMLEIFTGILPSDYIPILKLRISKLTLSTKGKLLNILKSEHSVDTKFKIIIKRYFYGFYHIYIKIKLGRARNKKK
jgi:hypothetical protein